jgi:hypothetical protein
MATGEFRHNFQNTRFSNEILAGNSPTAAPAEQKDEKQEDRKFSPSLSGGVWWWRQLLRIVECFKYFVRLHGGIGKIESNLEGGWTTFKTSRGLATYRIWSLEPGGIKVLSLLGAYVVFAHTHCHPQSLCCSFLVPSISVLASVIEFIHITYVLVYRCTYALLYLNKTYIHVPAMGIHMHVCIPSTVVPTMNLQTFFHTSPKTVLENISTNIYKCSRLWICGHNSASRSRTGTRIGRHESDKPTWASYRSREK